MSHPYPTINEHGEVGDLLIQGFRLSFGGPTGVGLFYRDEEGGGLYAALSPRLSEQYATIIPTRTKTHDVP